MTPSQRALLMWEPPPTDEIIVCGALSAGYGSGKSTGAALRFVREILSVPRWHPKGREQRPIAAIIGTKAHQMASTLEPIMERIMPPGLVVYRRRSPPDPHWIWHNGVKMLWRSLYSATGRPYSPCRATGTA